MITIKATGEGDLDEIVALERLADTAAWLAETGPAWHRRALADPDQEHLAAWSQDALVGFAVLAGLRGTPGSVELRRMVITPDRRGGGLGRALLRELVARGHDHHGASRVWLDVKHGNLRARALYESEGFVAEKTLVDAIAEPDGSHSDLIVMAHSGEPPDA